LSTAVVKVDIKVVNASITQNQRLQCVTTPLTHVEILSDATELNNDGTIKFVDVHYQTEPNLSFFSDRGLINDDSGFCTLILSAIDLQFHVFFFFEKLLLKVRFCL